VVYKSQQAAKQFVESFHGPVPRQGHLMRFQGNGMSRPAV
jgi:hypothetical protein